MNTLTTRIDKLLSKFGHRVFLVKDYTNNSTLIKVFTSGSTSIEKMLGSVTKMIEKDFGTNYKVVPFNHNYIVFTWTTSTDEYNAYKEILAIKMQDMVEIKKTELEKLQELHRISAHMVTLVPNLDTTTINALKTLIKD